MSNLYRWKIVLVVGPYRRTLDVGDIYMDWENLPFAHVYTNALRMAGCYTLYLALE